VSKTKYTSCIVRSSASGVDQSQHGGTLKVGSTGSTAGQEGVSLGSRQRVAEEGAASRQGVESSDLGVSTVKMNKKRWFSSHTQFPVGRGPDHKGYVHGM